MEASTGGWCSEAVDEDGEVGDAGEEAPLPVGLRPGAGAKEDDMEVRVRIYPKRITMS